MSIGSSFLSTITRITQSLGVNQPTAPQTPGPDIETLDLMDGDVRDAVGEELAALRRAKGWDEGKAAHNLGVPVIYLDGVEMGLMGLTNMGSEQNELRAWITLYGGSGPAFTAAVNRRVAKQ